MRTPSRSNASARRSPTPLRNLTGVSSRMRRTRAGVARRCMGHGASSSRRTSRSLGERVRVERLEIVDASHRRRGTGSAARARAAARRRRRRAPAVELGDDDPGGLHRLRESLPCCTAFWPTVPSSTSSVSCGAPGSLRGHHAHDLPQLIHQSFLRVQPARGVDDDRVEPARLAASMASNATAAGSPPGAPATHGKPSRSAHTCSCAMAPAR